MNYDESYSGFKISNSEIIFDYRTKTETYRIITRLNII
jgi:hypothetical protein